MADRKKRTPKKHSLSETWTIWAWCISAPDKYLEECARTDIHTKILSDMELVVCNAVKRGRNVGGTRSNRSFAHASEVQNIAYRFIGYPNAVQERQLCSNISGCRFFWNRLTGDSYTLYREMEIHLQNTPADYKDASGLEWLAELDSYALCNVQLDFDATHKAWLSGDCGRPQFKKKGTAKDSYTTNKDKRCNNLFLDDGMLTLPKITGKIRLKCHRDVIKGGILKTCTVTHEPDGRWMFSLTYEYPRQEERMDKNLRIFFKHGDPSVLRHIGLDMSIPHMYVDNNGNFPSYTNNGVTIQFEKAYRCLEDKIAREQRRLSRMEKDSQNYRKQCQKIARLHAKAKQQRTDFLEQLSTRLARDYDVISIEDLDISVIKRSLNFGKSVSDNGWGTFVTMLERKCARYGHLLIRVSKWFPSSKTCSQCGHIHKDLKLGDRTYICPVCGNIMDRDEQAGINIDREGIEILLRIFRGEAA